MLLLLLQRGNFVDPPLHDSGAAAAALDEVVGLFLIQCDLFLDGGIKFLRHFVALLRVVNDVKTVDAERVVILIHRAELLNERFKRVHFVHVLPWDEIQMPGRADLGGLQHPQIAQADRLDLPPVRADLIKLEQFLCPAAIADGINVGVEADVIIPKPIVAPVVKNICQLFILIRPLVERFLDQLTGIDVLSLSRPSFRPVQQIIVHALEARVPGTLIVSDTRDRLHLAAQGADRLPDLRICKLIHVHRLHDLCDAERLERFPQPFMGVHAAEAHKERVICKIACNIALERPLGEIGALLCHVAGDVDP